MKKLLLVFIALGFFVSLNAEEVKFSSAEEKEKKLAETEARYMEAIDQYHMTGNIDAYYQLYDYMGKGYIKLSFDVIIQIKNIESLKSDRFELSLNAVDDMGFSFKKKFKFNKDEIYKTLEGDSIIVLSTSIEKGIYTEMNITLAGNKGESASVTIPEYKTMNLSDLETKITEPIFIYSLNQIQDERFYRRGMFLVPTIDKNYTKSKTVGFYFEYYHLKTNVLTELGSYTMNYKLIHDLSNILIYEDTVVKESAPPNGNQQVYLDLSTATPGIYRVEVLFTDTLSKKSFEMKKYFKIGKDPEKEKEGENTDTTEE